MAIQFARMEPVSRSKGKNACCKSAYNAKAKVLCERTSRTYNFTRDAKNNLFHTILLPDYADSKFAHVEMLSNAVENSEHRCNSQLYKEYVLALPDNKEVTLDDKKELIFRFIAAKGFIAEGLGVQVDVHAPNERERNYHAHLLVTTRRFAPDGKSLGEKARDQNPDIRRNNGKAYIAAGKDDLGILWKTIQNQYFNEKKIPIQVDATHAIPQEHLGPVRMRALLNAQVQNQLTLHPDDMKALYGQAPSERLISLPSQHHFVSPLGGLLALLFSHRSVVSESLLINETADRDRLLDYADIHHEIRSGTLLELLDNKGEVMGWTTPAIRKQEERAVRFADRISQSHIGKEGLFERREQVKALFVQEKISLHQAVALEQLVGFSSKGEYSSLRVLSGVAGSGKSHVLGQLFTISQSHYSSVIALAPTHRAKEELLRQGYNTVDTLQHFLFTTRHLNKQSQAIQKLKGSLFVLDEAAMVDTETLLELLKRVWITQSELVLSGDDRQLTSIGPGGLFSYFAERYGAAQLTEIRRQANQWGKEVASHFSKNEAEKGMALLQQQQRHIHQSMEQTEREEKQLKPPQKEEKHPPQTSAFAPVLHSMCHLIKDWSNSAIPYHKRLIIAISNKQVNALNLAVRSLLQAQGKLPQEEYTLAYPDQKAAFAQGERIVFTKSMPEKGILAGSFGLLTEVSDSQFTVQLDRGKSLSFSPKEVLFKHGYASTVYKAQGASIEEVFVFHGRFSTHRNSYVKMSRHVQNIRFYSNENASPNFQELINQLKKPDERSASLAYRTREPSLNLHQRCRNWIQNKTVRLADLFHNNPRYYQVAEQTHPSITVEKQEAEPLELVELKPAPPDPKQPPENKRPSKPSSSQESIRLHRQENLQKLRQELQWGAERIAHQLLGEPNTTLSNKTQLRFGNKGSLIVNISGDKAGLWHDFSTSEGGDLLKLIMQRQNIGFNQAVKEARSLLGQSSIEPVFEEQRLKTLVKTHSAGEKVKRIQNLFSGSLPSHPVVRNYLSKGRGIEGAIPEAIRFLPSFWHSETQTRLPALMAFARNSKGEIQGGQVIYLDAELACKADIHPNKRSLGVIKGNFVEIQSASMGITLLAEGVETALSLKEAQIPGRILCSLGVGNFKNYVPQANETVIICADNDGKSSPTEKAVAKAVTTLQKQCANVCIVQPKEMGDFNDVLRHQGKAAVQQLILPELSNHIAPEWLSLWQQQEEKGLIKADLLCSQEIAVVEQQIASRQSTLDQLYHDYAKELGEIEQWSSSEQVQQLKKELHQLSHSRENKLKTTHLHCFEQFVHQTITQLDKDKVHSPSLEKLIDLFQEEKAFCNTVYEHYFPQVEALRKKGMEAIPCRRAMYRNHPTLIEDFKRDVLYSAKHAHHQQDKQDRQAILQTMSHQSLFQVQTELFAFCQKQTLKTLSNNLETIKSNGSLQQGSKTYHNKKELMAATYADQEQQPYLLQEYQEKVPGKAVSLECSL